MWVCTHTPVVARGPPQGLLFTLVFETVSLVGLGLALIENQVQNVALRKQKQFEMQPGEEMAMCHQPLLRGVLEDGHRCLDEAGSVTHSGWSNMGQVVVETGKELTLCGHAKEGQRTKAPSSILRALTILRGSMRGTKTKVSRGSIAGGLGQATVGYTVSSGWLWGPSPLIRKNSHSANHRNACTPSFSAAGHNRQDPGTARCPSKKMLAVNRVLFNQRE